MFKTIRFVLKWLALSPFVGAVLVALWARDAWERLTCARGIHDPLGRLSYGYHHYKATK